MDKKSVIIHICIIVFLVLGLGCIVLYLDTSNGFANFDKNSDSAVTGISTDVELLGKKCSIQGFYLPADDKWGFVMPLSFENGEKNFKISFENGNSEVCNAMIEDGFGILSIYDKEYQVAMLHNDSVKSLYVDTTSPNGYDYLVQDKLNALNGKVYEIDNSAEIVKSFAMKKVRGHGNDSWEADKKSFNIILNEELPLCGINGTGKYALLAGYRNNSLLAYIITRDLAKELGYKYAHDYAMTDLYIDGKYLGLYFLTNKVENSPSAIDIEYNKDGKMLNNRDNMKFVKPKAEYYEDGTLMEVYYDMPDNSLDVTGGYIFEVNSDVAEDECSFFTKYGMAVTFKNLGRVTKYQADYAREYFDDFEEAIMASDGYNSKGIYYADYIDIDSFAKSWIMYDLAMENSLTSSIFMYKDSDNAEDNKLHFWYIWDAESSFSDMGYSDDEVWLETIDERRTLHKCYFWSELYDHADFREAVNQCWINDYIPAMEILLADGPIHNENGISSLDWYSEYYMTPSVVNGYLWPGNGIVSKSEEIKAMMQKSIPFLTKYYSEMAGGKTSAAGSTPASGV